MKHSLQNKKVLITRTGEQSIKFSKQVSELGGYPIVFPLIELVAINAKILTEQLSQNNFDWIIFTSPQAVRFFFEENTLSKKDTKVAAVGNGTEKELNKRNVEVDFIPSEYTAKQLANEIPVLSNQHIFIPRSSIAKNDIVEILEQRNCKVTALSIYKNTSINYSEKEVEAVNKQQVDFITFTSGSTVQSFVANKIDANNSKVVCIGPETAKIANDLSIVVDGIAHPHSLVGLLDKIIVIASP